MSQAFTHAKKLSRDIVSALDSRFGGIDTTGSIDATAALQAAVTAAAHRTLHLPKGSYRVTGPIVSAAPIRIIGDGIGSSGTYIFTEHSTASEIFQLNAGQCVVQNIKFGVIGTTKISGAFVRFGGDDCEIDNFDMIGGFYGVQLYSAGSRLRVMNGSIRCQNLFGTIGVRIEAVCNDFLIKNVRAYYDGGGYSTNATGISVVFVNGGTGGGGVIENCQCLDLGAGVKIDYLTGALSPERVSVENTRIKTSLVGVRVGGGTGTTGDVLIDGCAITSSTDSAIWTSGDIRSLGITNTKANADASNSVWLTEPVDVLTIDACEILSPSAVGVVIPNNSTNFRITSSKISDCAQYGIQLGNGCDQYVIAGNDLTDNGVSYGSISQAPSSTSRTVANNTPVWDWRSMPQPKYSGASGHVSIWEVGSPSITTGKQYDLFRVTGTPGSAGAGTGFRMINYDLTFTDVANAYAVIGIVKNAGSGTVKGHYSRVESVAGGTGDCMAVEAAVRLNGGTSVNTIGYGLNVGDGVLYGFRAAHDHGTKALIDYGMVWLPEIGYKQAFIRGFSRQSIDATADGDAFSWIDANSSSVLFDVDYAGNIRGQNLTFLNTGKRIYGDLTHATHANRVLFQTSAANSTSNVGVIPSGTGNTAGYRFYNASDPDNAGFGSLIITNAWVQLQTHLTGTGASLPFRINTNNTQAFSIDTSQNVIIGTAALATNATAGFPWVPSCAGVPSGAPTAPYTNAAACVVDTTNSRVYFLVGGTWKYAALI